MKTIYCSILVCSLLCATGCVKPAQPPKAADTKPTTEASPEATPEAVARETINKSTQNVLDLDEALASGAVLASTQATETDPLLQSAAAYRTTVGKLGAMAVQQAIQIRDAQSIQDPKPLSYQQFMTDIIKKDQPDGIQLAMLPYYQEYAWDVKTQKLVVVDFPARERGASETTGQ